MKLKKYVGRSLSMSLLDRYNAEKNRHDSSNPLDWFSYEEIVDFIEKNICEPVTDEEKDIDEQIRQIFDTVPEVMRYFTFPYAWEKNGLADKVRGKYNY